MDYEEFHNQINKLRSSYKQNRIGKKIQSIIIEHRPNLCIELGVLDGYSAFHIAKALKENEENNLSYGSYLCVFDLWEDYDFKHGNMKSFINMAEKLKLKKYIETYKMDAFNVHKYFGDYSIDFLHIDISNDGDKIRTLIKQWHNKIKMRGVVVIEGGSEERDNVEWMIRFKKPSIKKEIENNEIINKFYDYEICTNFPSITLMTKKSGDILNGIQKNRS